MAVSFETIESWHGAIIIAQQVNERLFRDRLESIKASPLPIAQVMSDVRAYVGGVVIGESKPLVGTAMGLIDKKKYGEYLRAAEAAVPPIETWVKQFEADISALGLKDGDAIRRSGQAILKLAQQTRTLAMLAKMLELAMVDAPSESDDNLGLSDFDDIDLDSPSNSGKAEEITAIMTSTSAQPENHPANKQAPATPPGKQPLVAKK